MARAKKNGASRRKTGAGAKGRRNPDVAAFEERLGYEFKTRAALEAAWVHPSAASERKLSENYERLEFLGDAVLGMVAAAWLYRENPNLPEGELSLRKNALVSASALARYAREIGLGEHLVLGVGEERSGGRDKVSLLADSLEAVFAAVYLEGGIPAASKVVERFLQATSAIRDIGADDAKSDLQKRLHAGGHGPPVYRVSDESGPDHDKRYSVEVLIDGEVAGRGTGTSRKAAELDAARRVLEDGVAGSVEPVPVPPGDHG